MPVPTAEEIAPRYIPENITIIKSKQIGRAKASKAVIIGGYYAFRH